MTEAVPLALILLNSLVSSALAWWSMRLASQAWDRASVLGVEIQSFWADPDAPEVQLRDLFLLAKAIGPSDSMKIAALTYDAVIANLGAPGAGYDPAALYDAVYEAGREPRRLYREIEESGGTAALKAGGWLP